MTYREFLSHNINLSPLGVMHDDNPVSYFCTPKGAKIIGRLGVDGIHFCFVRGHGERVFIVTPMGDVPYCYPVANSFEDFLSIILAVGDAGITEMLHAWSPERLMQYKNECPMSTESEETRNALLALGIKPISDPCAYCRRLYSEFDRDELKFSQEYYEITGLDLPLSLLWNVCYNSDKRYPCEEHRVDKSFSWRGQCFCIPAYYVSKKGLVADICFSIEPNVIASFKKRISDAKSDSEIESLSEISPTDIRYSPSAEADGRWLAFSSSVAYYYAPADEDFIISADSIAELAIEHYGLDPKLYHVILRVSFDKPPRSRLSYESITITLRDDPAMIPGDLFSVEDDISEIELMSPIDEKAYTLTVHEYSQNTIPIPQGFDAFPNHVTTLTYSLSPELDRHSYLIRDIAPSDKAVASSSPRSGESDFASSIAIIGGADGPTAVVFGSGSKPNNARTVASNPRFCSDAEPVWQISWRSHAADDITITLK